MSRHANRDVDIGAPQKQGRAQQLRTASRAIPLHCPAKPHTHEPTCGVSGSWMQLMHWPLSSAHRRTQSSKEKVASMRAASQMAPPSTLSEWPAEQRGRGRGVGGSRGGGACRGAVWGTVWGREGERCGGACCCRHWSAAGYRVMVKQARRHGTAPSSLTGQHVQAGAGGCVPHARGAVFGQRDGCAPILSQQHVVHGCSRRSTGG